MKKAAAIAFGVLVLFAAVPVFNVWRAGQEPIARAPSAVEIGRMQLHAQLEDAQKTEDQAEKPAWDSVPELRQLIKWHQQRIEKLDGNPEAGEILAYDRESIDRLETRITALGVLEAAREEAAKEAEKEAAKDAEQNAQNQ